MAGKTNLRFVLFCAYVDDSTLRGQLSRTDLTLKLLTLFFPLVLTRCYFGMFVKKRLSRPADIRFGQFKVCGTCDCVLQSHVTSFGVGFHKLSVAWRLPQPYVELVVRAYLGDLFVIFAKKCLSWPVDIRFGQFEACGTCDYVVQIHVVSLGV